MSIVLDNVAQVAGLELERAAQDIKTPIKLTYVPYIDGSQDPQAPALTLDLTRVQSTISTITATASRVDMFKKKVPTRNFDSWIFEGLRT